MLSRLSISNFALIDSLELLPDPHLSIITGETGAGKSIMLGALGLLLGEKAAASVTTDKDRKTVVEAEFSGIPEEVTSLMSDIDPEWNGGSIILRRELSPGGRSRAFVEDSPVKISVLADIARRLVDIHSQHSNMLLTLPANQLRLIDALADNTAILEDYRSEFRTFLQLRNTIKQIREENERNRSNRRIYEFQLEELRKLNPKQGELEAVERRFDILSDAEEIREHLSSAFAALNGGVASAVASISDAMDSVSMVDMSLFEHDIQPILTDDMTIDDFSVLERLRQAYIEIKDIAETIGEYASQVDSDPSELATVTTRMNDLYAARKHFNVADADALVELRDSLERKLSLLDSESGDLEELERKAKASAVRLKAKADALTASRMEAAARFEKRLMEDVRPLGLPNLLFKVDFSQGKFSREGVDQVEFLTTFNKNMPLQPMSKVASGGELSRLMLCIKNIMARSMNLPTVIFDEIDTGVSGEIADRMGAMMKEMGEDSQVIAITHLPQVASKGSRHFKVFKKDNDLRTVSDVKCLSQEERVVEIAGMLSGETLNDAALNAARALLAL